MVFRVVGSAVAVPSDQKRNHDEREAEMAEMSSMSESEIYAVMEEQSRKNQEEKRKFLEYHYNTQGDTRRSGTRAH